MHYRNDKDVSIARMRNPKRGPNDLILITEKCSMLKVRITMKKQTIKKEPKRLLNFYINHRCISTITYQSFLTSA